MIVHLSFFHVATLTLSLFTSSTQTHPHETKVSTSPRHREGAMLLILLCRYRCVLASRPEIELPLPEFELGDFLTEFSPFPIHLATSVFPQSIQIEDLPLAEESNPITPSLNTSSTPTFEYLNNRSSTTIIPVLSIYFYIIFYIFFYYQFRKIFFWRYIKFLI